MKSVVLLATSSLLFAASAFAQTPPTKALPPPGINDPGVHATAPAATPAKKPLDLKPHAVPSTQANVVAAPDTSDALPDVAVRKEGDNTIQEYRRNGQLYMVVVTPKTGIPHTYTVDPQGRLVDEHGQKPTRPVMYKVLEWGKSPPATDDSTPADTGR
ncbi:MULTISPECIES: DUF2782 domain-containing protein [Rhodanobacter]|uniref:DUF2782 domain-containing protein n=1 Tax=Rhodanobacter ginsenosidimutans TaxID=490571 RepID=A0ABW0JT85_9GAMM|nr:DUF2782 domain-containing protein [Rhodanobacter sp. Root627]KRA33350.1 hypothetical protein ASD68_10065 [Rhodanobacter sp. Root627]